LGIINDVQLKQINIRCNWKGGLIC